jgi:phosphotransferase system enzyme I (PtsI)
MNVDAKSIALKGVAASPGIIIGKAVVLAKEKVDIKPSALAPGEVNKEIADFKKAIDRVKNDLINLSQAVGKRLGEEYGRIFEAQAMIADDHVINGRVIEQIREKKLHAAYLYYDEINKVIEQLSQSSDPYLKERILDINSVGTRLLGVLQGAKRAVVKDIEGPTVVIARYLAPSDLLSFSVRKKIGIAMELGGVTSHTSLLAKSLNLPAVVGIGPKLDKVNTGDRVIIDGYSGRLMVNPESNVTSKFRRRLKFLNDLNETIAGIKNKPAITKDKRRVRVLNNIELPSETSKVIKSGAEGIGLFRTEYLFITEDSFPDFDRQYQSYRTILTKMKKSPVLIRTFDLGGDKFVADRLQTVDANPFLGWRAIRYCLDNPEVFKTQLKALLKASVFGNLGIMLPMISNLDELTKARELLEECKSELRSEGVKFKKDIPLGIMIEVPSAALLAEYLAREVDFFSIGTNDLIQYTLAVDRTNEKLTGLYQNYNPAVLNLIQQTIDAAHRHDVKVGVCGEMASDPLAAILFVGMGVDELSSGFLSTGMIKYTIRNIDFKRAKQIAETVINMRTSAEVEEYLKEKTMSYFPNLMPLVDFIEGINNG